MGELIQKNKLFLILRNQPREKQERIVEAAYEGGIRLFEVTFSLTDKDTEKHTAETLEMIYRKFGNTVECAAGTVIKPQYVKTAADAGATCIVAPNTDLEVGRLAHEHHLLWCPGCFTPSEIVFAYQMGADVVKIFPIMPHQLDYLKQIMTPLKGIPFMPTGGVNPDTIRPFMELGASLLGTGLTIITPEAVNIGNYQAITDNALIHVNLMRDYL